MNRNEDKKLLITISKDSEVDELYDILTNNCSNLPFSLPSHVMFPNGKKEYARRAKMLMLAGLDFLKEKYPNDSKTVLLNKDSSFKQNTNQDIINF